MTDNQSGFTIIEVIIAMTMLAVALLGLLGATGSAVRALSESDRMVTAAFRANEQLEQLEALGCDAANSGTASEQGVNLSWTVAGAPTDRSRPIMLTATYQMGRGRVRVDTFEKALQCVR